MLSLAPTVLFEGRRSPQVAEAQLALIPAPRGRWRFRLAGARFLPGSALSFRRLRLPVLDFDYGQLMAAAGGQVHQDGGIHVWAWPPRLPRAATRYPGQFSNWAGLAPWGLYPRCSSISWTLRSRFRSSRFSRRSALSFNGLEHHFSVGEKFRAFDELSTVDFFVRPVVVVLGMPFSPRFGPRRFFGDAGPCKRLRLDGHFRRRGLERPQREFRPVDFPGCGRRESVTSLSGDAASLIGDSSAGCGLV